MIELIKDDVNKFERVMMLSLSSFWQVLSSQVECHTSGCRQKRFENATTDPRKLALGYTLSQFLSQAKN